MEHLALEQFGVRLRAARREKGLTQEELASGFTTKGHISQLEKSHSFPSLPMLVRLAKRLDVPISSLLGEEESEVPPAWVVETLESIASLEFNADCHNCNKIMGEIFHLLAKMYDHKEQPHEALLAYRRASQLLIGLLHQRDRPDSPSGQPSEPSCGDDRDCGEPRILL